MKVMIFPVQSEKFTGFCDKFLKNDGHIKNCKKKSYHANLSVLHSDIAAKKVFWKPRICPHLPAGAPAGRAFWPPWKRVVYNVAWHWMVNHGGGDGGARGGGDERRGGLFRGRGPHGGGGP